MMGGGHELLGVRAGTHTRAVYHSRYGIGCGEHRKVTTGTVFPVYLTETESRVLADDGSDNLEEWDIITENECPTEDTPSTPVTTISEALENVFPRADLTFKVNGIEHSVDPTSIDPRMKLAEYLRYHLALTGTKIGCGEGGCGACTVAIETTAADGTTSVASANSCLHPVLACGGTNIITVEGVAASGCGKNAPSSATGAAAVHSIPQALAAGSGSQCGYCSPGMVMSMWSLLASVPKGSSLTAVDVDERFQGNICRCTGYRSILTAFHALASKTPTAANNVAGADSTDEAFHSVPLPRATTMSVHADSGLVWISATTLADVFTALSKVDSSTQVRLTTGNTSVGVVKYYPASPADTPTLFLHVATVPELVAIDTSASVQGLSGVSLGSSVTLSALVATCTRVASSEQPQFAAIARHIGGLVAHWQVRDQASWCGNIMLAKQHKDFPSDVLLCLLTAGSLLTLENTARATQTMSLEAFLTYDMPVTEIVVSVFIPYTPTAAGKSRVFDTHKVMLRHVNAHPIVNAGFALQVDATTKAITSCRIVYGGIIQGPSFCPSTTTFLTGKPLSLATWTGALPVLKQELVPGPPSVPDPNFVVASGTYRQATAVALLYKFFLTAMVQVLGTASIDPDLVSATQHYKRPAAAAGTRTFPPPPASEAPVGEAIPKVEGLAQCAGATQYTSDTTLPPGCLFAAPVLAKAVPGSKITAVDASAALQLPGVKGFVTANDARAIGASNTVTSDEHIVFATDDVKFYGQLVGLVCATSIDVAQLATDLVRVTYGTADTPCVLDHKHGERVQEFRTVITHTETDVSDATPVRQRDDMIAPAVTGTIKTSGQKHFYMETQTTLAVPQPDNGLHVLCATQALSLLRGELALALGKLENKITVTNTQVGGAYGGKAFMHVAIATAASTAAIKLNAPVLLQLSRNDDMTMLGGRQPASATFNVNCSASGVITAMQLTASVDGGCSKSGGVATTSLNAYDIKGARLSSSTVVTDTPMNSIMRAPGDFQGAFFTEAAIEFAAANLGVDPAVVQEANMSKDVTAVWSELKTSADVATKRADVTKFNATNRWRKRGIYCQPALYHITTAGVGQRCVVAVHADGSVSVNNSGIEMGNGLNTKVLQAVVYELSQVAPGLTCPSPAVTTVAPKSTATFPDVTPTWGSTGSESCVFAACQAAKTLVTTLNKYKSATDNFADVARKAAAAGAKMTEEGYHRGADGGTYPVASAACAVVELDVLTGECVVLSADIVYDCGTSLNPAIDIGQIEGSFVQSMGFCLTEEQTRSKVNGRLISNGTWDYKPPSAMDIPLELNVRFTNDANTASKAVLGSKASGEPAYLLGPSVFFALKNAVYAARAANGAPTGWFALNAPATPEAVSTACATVLT
eukprot:m.44741 g.44741  ORF g.44741 m.44741 type:complete len:1384 (+) comp15101_c0_seq3:127-4278(+)